MSPALLPACPARLWVPSWEQMEGQGRGCTTIHRLAWCRSEVSDSLLEDLIAAHLVLPNRVTLPVKKGLDVTHLRFPLPCVSTHHHRVPGPVWRDGQTGWW